MTDFETTQLCASAMWPDAGEIGIKELRAGKYIPYDPLHDDAQAMALVKKFGITIVHNEEGTIQWTVGIGGLDTHPFDVDAYDLNRAICECVAKMQGEQS